MSLIKDGKVYRTTEEQVAWLTKIKYNSYQKEDIDKIVETLNQEIDTKAEKQEVNSIVANLEQQINTKQDKQEFNSTVSNLEQQINTKQDKQEFLSTVANLEQQINTKQDKLVFDTTPTVNSTNPVTSGGVYNAIETEKQEVNQTVETLNQKINTKQDKLNFDSTPTQNSTNPVTSGGVYNSLSQKTTTRVNGVITNLEFNSNPQSQIGDLTSLATTDKSSLVGAINEVKNSSGVGLQEVVLYDRTLNNGTAITLKNNTPVNLANYGLVGNLKDYKYINLTYSDGVSTNHNQTSALIRIDQAFLDDTLSGSTYNEYPVLISYYYKIGSSKYTIGNYRITFNKSNQINITEKNELFGNGSTLTTNTNTSSLTIYIYKISLLK